MRIDELRSFIAARDRAAQLRSLEHAYGVFGDVEKRTFRTSAELRVAGTTTTGTNDGTIQVIGHAAVFGQPSVEMMSPFGMFTEYIDSRAFNDVLKRGSDVILTWDHDTRYVLGRTVNRTLELSVDGEGLRYWSRVAPTSYAEDLKILMEGGYLDQSSFMFRIAPGGEEWEIVEDDAGNEFVKRTVYQISDLYDVCVTVSGAYPTTDSGLLRTSAMAYAISRGYAEERKAIPFKETPKADKDMAWDGGAQVKEATPDDLMAMCAWYDPEKKDSDGNLVKGAFKLPHHEAEGEHAVVWKGVAAAMARLNQSNTAIPDADRKGVYNHLKKHYAQFDEAAPDLRSRAEIMAESRAETEVLSEARVAGAVEWGPEEGINDLVCDLECQLPFGMGVWDVSVNLNKAIIVDWDEWVYFSAPFTMENEEPVLSSMDQWIEIETAWVSVSEGFEANIAAAKTRRETRMSDTPPVETPVEEVEDAVEEVEETPTRTKDQALAEARAMIASLALEE